jgi:hypothetical protein
LATKSTRIRLIDEVDDALAAAGARDAHLPALVERADADQVDRCLRRAGDRVGEPLGRAGMADGQAHILAVDVSAEQFARRGIAVRHTPVGDDQHRLCDRIEHFIERGGGGRDLYRRRRHQRVAIFADRDDQHGGDTAEHRDEHRLRAATGQQNDRRRRRDGAECDKQAMAKSREHAAPP